MPTYPVVLAGRSRYKSSELYSSSPEGLGPSITTVDGAIDLRLHDKMTFTFERTSVGLLGIQCWGRDKEDRGKSKKRDALALKEKESFQYFKSDRAVAEFQKKCQHHS